MEREVRYCTTEDGVRIAYCVEGAGPAILMLPSFIESFSPDNVFPAYRQFFNDLSMVRTLVRFDARGIGLSQRSVNDLSVEALLRDGSAVVNACQLHRFDLWATSTSGPFAIEYSLRYPERVGHLVLLGTCSRLLDVFPAETLETFARLAADNWDIASRFFADLDARSEFPEAALQLAEWYRQSTTGDMAAKYIREHHQIDVGDRLGGLRVPTLVLHRVDAKAFPFSSAQTLASTIPNARLVPLAMGGWPGFGESKAIIETVVGFLEEDSGTSPGGSIQPTLAQGAFRTILFTDLVGHTEMMSRLGDDKGRDVLREHERITREVLKANGGTEVKTMGDGFMASFGSVTKAVECAIALQRAFAEREGEPLSVRVGLNAGEPIEEDGDLFGGTVILASRIAAKAEGGEILVADTVRGLCTGKGFLFADRGEFVAKGFEEPVRVYEVSWRDTTAS